MTQTEQKSAVRTFGQQVVALGECLFFSDRISLLDSTDIASRHIQEAEARGAAEQRRKDAEGQEAVAWLIQDKSKGKPGRAYSPDRAVTDKTHAAMAARFNNDVSDLYSRPANVAALEARIAELEAEKADAGWTFLAGNMSGDPRLPSCRLSRLFQEGDNFTRFKQAAEEFGIEVILKSDEREEEDWDEELSAEMLSRLEQHENLHTDGWSFVDVWDDEDGYIVRLFARPIRAALTREGGE